MYVNANTNASAEDTCLCVDRECKKRNLQTCMVAYTRQKAQWVVYPGLRRNIYVGYHHMVTLVVDIVGIANDLYDVGVISSTNSSH